MLGKVFKISEMEIPMIGLGTRNLMGQPCRKILTTAFYKGYKLLDTNPDFHNEWMIKESLKYSKREELFIISRIPPSCLDYTPALDSFARSLKNMNLEYIDLVLLGSPGKAEIPGKSRMNAQNRAAAWRALVDLKKQGSAKHIGVANFLPRHIDTIWDKYKYNPEASMIEFHPFCFEESVYQYHQEKKIQIIAACPLANMKKELWDNEKLIEFRRKFQKSRGQILLKWAIQKGAVVIPKTKIMFRLTQNSQLDFEINEEDMKIIDEFANGARLLWNTETIK